MYQLTPEASKGNAFCWLSYTPRIDWTRRNDGQEKRSLIIEQKRAAGIDPLHIPGMASGAHTGPLDPMRFSTLDRRKRA